MLYAYDNNFSAFKTKKSILFTMVYDATTTQTQRKGPTNTPCAPLPPRSYLNYNNWGMTFFLSPRVKVNCCYKKLSNCSTIPFPLSSSSSRCRFALPRPRGATKQREKDRKIIKHKNKIKQLSVYPCYLLWRKEFRLNLDTRSFNLLRLKLLVRLTVINFPQDVHLVCSER